ncbi:hypothetical protein, partial [Actinomadura rubrisoli]
MTATALPALFWSVTDRPRRRRPDPLPAVPDGGAEATPAAIFTSPAEAAPRTTLLALDVVASGPRYRDHAVRSHFRRQTHAVLREAFEIGALPWWEFRREDRGDGILITAPPRIPPVDLLDP